MVLGILRPYLKPLNENKKKRNTLIFVFWITSINDISKNLKPLGQNAETHFQGFLHGKPLNYWDYIQTDALLNLQIQRSTLPDEMVFIVYHQINELLFKMIPGKLTSSL